MAEHEARTRALYDHDEEEPRPARRRRPVADWGVGDELFDHMPRRRFERRPGHEPGIPRGGADDGRRTIRIDGDEPALPPAEDDDEAFASREEALTARREHDAVWGGDEPFADESPAPADDLPDGIGALAAGTELPPRSPAARAGSVAAGHGPAPRGPQAGRRTVRIGGRPGELPALDRSHRRRPPRTVHERVGTRPDRVAAWAFALGILLILIAIATAGL